MRDETRSDGEAGGGTLVIQPLPGIGDVIWHLPHIRAIAEATEEGKVTLLTKRRSMADDLLAGCDFVRDVMWLDREDGHGRSRHDGPLGGFRLGRDLRDRRFRRVWILHGSSRYGLATAWAGIPERIGYGLGWQRRFLTTADTLPATARRASAIDKATRLLELNGLSTNEAGPRLPIPAERLGEVREAHDDVPRPWVSLAIGASEPFKQWGAERFGALARALLETGVGGIFLLGGPAERTLADDIADEAPDDAPMIPVIGRPLLHGAAIAAESALCIGNDTGMLNVAAAVGTPSIGLFGGSPVLTRDPRVTALTPPGGEVAFGRNHMAEIAVDTVTSAARSILGTGLDAGE